MDNDLTLVEQNHVRAALRHLHRRAGSWEPVAAALHTKRPNIFKALSGRCGVTASLAVRVARLAGVMIDDLLVGRFLPPGACPNCGHVVTSDFKDESTIAEDAPRRTVGDGLSLVK